jgi:hypothetical protein
MQQPQLGLGRRTRQKPTAERSRPASRG